jgi:Spy/CpxP family protein refolding chaperone
MKQNVNRAAMGAIPSLKLLTMHRWKFSGVLLACLVAGGVEAQALSGKGGGYPNPAAHPHRLTLDDRIERMGQRLSLTDTQKSALKVLLEGERVAGQRIWEDPAATGADKIRAYRVLDRQTTQKIRDLLTEEQRQKYGLGPKEPPPVPFVPSSAVPGLK